MTGLERYAGRKVGILGMARSGLAAARALAAAGADVLAFDDRPEAVAETPFRAGRGRRHRRAWPCWCPAPACR